MPLPPLVVSSPAYDDFDDLSYSYRRRSCCFCVSPSWWHRISPKSAAGNRRWWKRGWIKVRHWSELVAGPRWKTFLGRFNRRGGSRQEDFRYDPLSYAMNFDEGPGQEGQYDKDQLGRDFSCRYASFSRDHDDGDGPHFT